MILGMMDNSYFGDGDNNNSMSSTPTPSPRTPMNQVTSGLNMGFIPLHSNQYGQPSDAF